MKKITIKRNPEDAPKEIEVDRELVGGGATGRKPNFEELFQIYPFGNERHYGTKADVINIRGFLTYLGQRVDVDLSNLNIQLDNLLWDSGYLSCFWNKPREIHHRDLMRHYFGNIATSIEEASQKPGTPLDLRERLETAQLELLCALDELGEAKVNSSLHIGEVARKILELSQGYVFYSEEPQKEVDLWKCGLYRIKLESKITKDQLERGAMPASEESDRNVSVLLNALNGVDFRTHRVFLPVSHAIPTHYFPHKSYRPIGRPGSRWVSEDVQLKVHYESDCSRRIVN